MFDQLIRTHPRLGKAAYGAYFESDLTGEHDGRRVNEILRHDEAAGRCGRCGGRERRTSIKARTLVGVNRGNVHSWYSVQCENPRCGGTASNYAPPWERAA